MLLPNLTVLRVASHFLPARNLSGEAAFPTYGPGILDLDQLAKSQLAMRIVDAVGARSKSIDLLIHETDGGSAVRLASDITVANDPTFLQLSRKAPDKLAQAQTHRNIPESVILVIHGNCGSNSQHVVCFLKAELQNGFRYSEVTKIEFIESLFMTPDARFYKMGVFLHDGQGTSSDPLHGWTAAVFDSHISNANRSTAARYFYGGFLGCRFLQDAARKTEILFEATGDFIRDELVAPPERKIDLEAALHSYLVAEQSPVVSTREFSGRVFSAEEQDHYFDYLETTDAPDTAFEKDLTTIKRAVVKQEVKFSGGIRLIAPLESMKSMVSLETISAEDAGGTSGEQWTRILIKGSIQQ